MGSGHGWTMGWAVAWNCVAKTLRHPEPAGRDELGDRLHRPSAIRPRGRSTRSRSCREGVRFARRAVTPQSLYLAQLEERLGPQALKNIGYASNTPRGLPTDRQRLPDLKTESTRSSARTSPCTARSNAGNVRGTARANSAAKKRRRRREDLLGHGRRRRRASRSKSTPRARWTSTRSPSRSRRPDGPRASNTGSKARSTATGSCCRKARRSASGRSIVSTRSRLESPADDSEVGPLSGDTGVRDVPGQGVANSY